MDRSDDIKCLRKHLTAAMEILLRLEAGAEIPLKKAPRLSKETLSKQRKEKFKKKYL